MPVEQIELDSVQMMEVSDDALETLVRGHVYTGFPICIIT
jgi:hypothetical protein